MDFQVIKTINIDLEEFIKTEQVNENNIVQKVARYCEQLQEIGYKIIISERSKLHYKLNKILDKLN
jgi:hypothetical protein